MESPVLPRNWIETLEPEGESVDPVAVLADLPGEVSAHPVVVVLSLCDRVAPEGDRGQLGAEVEETDRVEGDKVVAGKGEDENTLGVMLDFQGTNMT